MTQQNSDQPRGSGVPVSGPARGPMGGRPGRGPMGGDPMGGMMPGDKPKSFRKTMATFLGYLKPYRIRLIIALVFAIASTVFSIIGPKLLGNATTKLFEGVVAKVSHVPGASIDFGYIGEIVLILIGLYILSSVFLYILGYIMSGISMKVTYDIRKRIAEKIKRLPLKYFDTKSHGEILSHVTNDVDTISTTLTQNLSQIVTSITTIIGVLVMMLTISWLMTVVALVIIPIAFVLISVVVKGRGGAGVPRAGPPGSRRRLGASKDRPALGGRLLSLRFRSPPSRSYLPGKKAVEPSHFHAESCATPHIEPYGQVNRHAEKGKKDRGQASNRDSDPQFALFLLSLLLALRPLLTALFHDPGYGLGQLFQRRSKAPFNRLQPYAAILTYDDNSNGLYPYAAAGPAAGALALLFAFSLALATPSTKTKSDAHQGNKGYAIDGNGLSNYRLCAQHFLNLTESCLD